LAAPVHAGSWQTVDAPHSMGTKWIAAVDNENGDSLRVFRKIARAGYEAYAELTLGANQRFGDLMPSYRIDQGPIEDTTVLKIAGQNMGAKWAYTDGNRAVWRIWQGTDTAIEDNPMLRPWIKGNHVAVHYVDATGKSRSAEFSLKGSGQAISEAMTGPFQ
jgi:hypothetical protein